MSGSTGGSLAHLREVGALPVSGAGLAWALPDNDGDESGGDALMPAPREILSLVAFRLFYWAGHVEPIPPTENGVIKIAEKPLQPGKPSSRMVE
jgi:hypothetical protein